MRKCGVRKKFHLQEYPRSGSKAIDVKERKRERKIERAKIGNKNGQLRIVNATSGGARKPSGPKRVSENNGQLFFHRSRLDQKIFRLKKCMKADTIYYVTDC